MHHASILLNIPSLEEMECFFMVPAAAMLLGCRCVAHLYGLFAIEHFKGVSNTSTNHNQFSIQVLNQKNFVPLPAFVSSWFKNIPFPPTS
jgi:hypothetical protein